MVAEYKSGLLHLFLKRGFECPSTRWPPPPPRHPSSSCSAPRALGLPLCSELGCPEASGLSQGSILVHCWVHVRKQVVPLVAPRVPPPHPAGVCAGEGSLGQEAFPTLRPLAAPDRQIAPHGQGLATPVRPLKTGSLGTCSLHGGWSGLSSSGGTPGPGSSRVQ